jgi:hypothetical protein
MILALVILVLTFAVLFFWTDAVLRRILEGNFTEEEFQNFCHNLKTEDVERFCDGCEQYQIKLFGKSPITELRKTNE